MPNNRQAMIDKYGSEEAYREAMRLIGSKGGKAKVPTKGNGYVKVHGHKKKDHVQPEVR